MANIMRLGGGGGKTQYVWDKYTTDLPTGYTQVEYIESTGTQYIDTGFAASEGFITSAVFEFTTLKSGAFIVGSHNTTTPYGRNGFCPTDNLLWQLALGDNLAASATPVVAGTKYTVEASTVKGASYLTVNGNRLVNSSDSTQRSSANLMVFCNQYALAFSQGTAPAKLYSLKIYDHNGTLVRDYVPCVNASGVAGLYDVENGVFYRNAGTGTFVVGDVANVEVRGEYIGQVKSADINAYPFYGVKDGYYYEAVGETVSINENGIHDVRGYVAANVNVQSAPVLLWTNANPTSSFPPQTVGLNGGDSDAYIVESRASTTNGSTSKSFVNIGDFGVCVAALTNNSAEPSPNRKITAATKTGISFGYGYPGASMSGNNIYAIPTRIWSVKFTV